MSQVLHRFFAIFLLPVYLPPSSSTRLSLPSHLVIEFGIKTINECRFLSRIPKNVNLYRNNSLHAGKKKTTPHFVTMQQQQCLIAEQMCHAHPVLHRLAQRPPSVPASTTTPEYGAYDDSKNSKKRRVAAPVNDDHPMLSDVLYQQCLSAEDMSDACPGFPVGMLNSSSVFTRIPPW